MVDNGTVQSSNGHTLSFPSCFFRVSISNIGDISCNNVSGLDTEYEEIAYCAGDSPVFTKKKMPGLRKSGDLTIKNGIIKDGKALLDWFDHVVLNIIQREVVTISLLDESGCPVKTWEATNAWPKKLMVDDSKSDSDTTCIETLVIAHEGVNVK